MNYSNVSLGEVFDERALRLDSKLAIRERDRSWSYSKLQAQSEELSNILTQIGVKKGHRVALMLPNSGAFVMSFWGIIRIEGVVAPFNTHYQDQELTYYLNDTAASALVVSQAAAARAKIAMSQIKNPPFLMLQHPCVTSSYS